MSLCVCLAVCALVCSLRRSRVLLCDHFPLLSLLLCDLIMMISRFIARQLRLPAMNPTMTIRVTDCYKQKSTRLFTETDRSRSTDLQRHTETSILQKHPTEHTGTAVDM